MNIYTTLKSTGERVEILPIPRKHVAMKVRDGRKTYTKPARDNHLLCLLPPQTPGHAPREQIIRASQLEHGKQILDARRKEEVEAAKAEAAARRLKVALAATLPTTNS